MSPTTQPREASGGSATTTTATDPGITQAGELRSARLESLRAIAAIAVLLGHVFGTAVSYDPQITFDTFFSRALLGGGFGVFLFFALSGYLLFWPFARRDFGGGDPINYRRYAVNRAVRILPLYYVAAIVVLALQEAGATPREWALFLTFSENFALDTVGQINGVVWSLVVEVHFYVLLPFLAWGLARLARRSLWKGAALLAILAAASIAFRLLTLPWGGDVFELSLPSTFFYFVAGMMIALLRIAWRQGLPSWLRGPLAWSGLWLLASVPLWAILFDHYDQFMLPAVASLLIVGACVLPFRPGPLVRSLEWKPLAMVGVVSYSLYIWHVPVLTALDDGSVPLLSGVVDGSSVLVWMLVGIPLCIAVAFASYALIEAPFLRLRRRWSTATPERVHADAPEIAKPATVEAVAAKR